MKKLVLVVSIVMIAVLLCVACVGCSAEDYKKKLEKDGYSVVFTVTNEDSTAAQIALSAAKRLFDLDGDVEYIVYGYRDQGGTCAYIKYEKTSDAKDFVEAVKSDSDYQKVSRVGGLVKVTYSTTKK